MAAALPGRPPLPESRPPPPVVAAGVVEEVMGLEELSVRGLKDLLWEHGLSDAGCFEKADLVARLRAAGVEGTTPWRDVAAEGASGGSAGSMASPGTSGIGMAAADAPQEHSPAKPPSASEWLGTPEHGPAAAPANVPAIPASCAGVTAAGAVRPALEGKATACAANGAPQARSVDWLALSKLLTQRKRLRGVVKLYNPEKCFGFVACEDTHPIFHRDVYISGRDFDEAEAVIGCAVTFILQLDGAGRPKAQDVMVEEAGPIACPDASRGSALDPDATYVGSIKSFQAETGFGFIACDETHKVFDRDVFLHHSQRNGFEVGDRVQFRIHVDPVKGMPKAKDLKEAGQGEDSPDPKEASSDRRSAPAPEPAAAPASPVAAAAEASPRRPSPAQASPQRPSPAQALTARAVLAEVPAAPDLNVGLCRVYALKGVCNIDACRYRHTETEAQASARSRLRDVCMHHMVNGCRWVGCDKRHPPEGEAEELRKLARIVPCAFGRTCRTMNCLYTHPIGHSPIFAVAGMLAAQGDAKRRDGSAPPRFFTGGAAPPRPAVVRQLRANAAAAAGLPPPPKRPVPVFPEDTLHRAGVAGTEEKAGQDKAAASQQAGQDKAVAGQQVGQDTATAGQRPGDTGGLDLLPQDRTEPEAGTGSAAEGLEEAREDAKSAGTGTAKAMEAAPSAVVTAGEKRASSEREGAGGKASEEASLLAEPGVPASGEAGAGPGPWKKYAAEDGSTWWWCEQDGDWLVEATPEPWVKYMDPNSGRHYWWKDESKWFWA